MIKNVSSFQYIPFIYIHTDENNHARKFTKYLSHMIIKILIQKIIKYVKPKINHMTKQNLRAPSPSLRLALTQNQTHDWRSQ